METWLKSVTEGKLWMAMIGGSFVAWLFGMAGQRGKRLSDTHIKIRETSDRLDELTARVDLYQARQEEIFRRLGRADQWYAALSKKINDVNSRLEILERTRRGGQQR